MKTFKEQMMWQQSLSTRLFDVAHGSSIGFNAFWMPLSSSIIKRIWPKEIRATVFHVTNATGYRSIKKMQGKKSGISAFFEMRGSYFEQGIQTSGGVVLELDANILGAFNQDIMSAPDTSGRRWVQLEFMKGRFGEKDLSKYQKGLQDLVGNLLKKYWQKVMNVSSTPRFQKGRYYIHWMNLGMNARENDKKTLHLIIKDYLDLFKNKIYGITGDPKKVFLMSKSWGVLSEKIFTEDGNYLINHSSSIILLKDGKYLSRISHHAKYEDIFKNINKYLR